MSTNAHPQIDICILCALAEEAERLKEAFEDASKEIFHDQPSIVFQQHYSAHLKRNYDYTMITNANGEYLSVLVTWLAGNGPLETSLQLHPLLEEFKPRFAAMTGICAGDREKVKLGDIIVAERAFLYDVGKIVEGKDGHPELQRDTTMWSPPTEVLHAVQGFRNWRQVVKKEPRPPSQHQQRDWLLNKLLDPNTLRVDIIPLQELEEHAPDWKKIVRELRQGGDKAYLTPERSLKDPARVLDLRYEEDFPFKDPAQPEVHIVTMTSGSTVRADNPFEEIRVPVRVTRAIDMEGAAFYRTFKEFSNIHYLLVKGVCDYADKEKDDSYHDYAGRISALYMLAFIRDYVTSSRFPGIGRKVPEPSSPVTSIQRPEPSPVKEPQNGLNLFYSYAPEDAKWHKELEKHLVSLMLKRQGPLKELYANNIDAGLPKDAAEFLEQAQIILLLISPDFIADDDLYERQLKRAIELQDAGKARFIPVLLRPTNLMGTPLEKITVVPKNYKPPISEWKSKDAAFVEVTQEIKAVVEKFKEGKL